MTSYLRGIGTAVPAHAISQSDAADVAAAFTHTPGKARRVLPELYKRSGVRSRHSVLLSAGKDSSVSPGDRQTFYSDASQDSDLGPKTNQRMVEYESHAVDLAAQACRSAFADGDSESQSITHLVTVSCTGFAAPGVDVGLIDRLSLRPDVARTHIGFMGCHAMLNALRVADAFAVSGADHRVLVCAVELCSLHHQYGWISDRIVANSLFADGAAAVIVSSDPSPSDRRSVLIERNGSIVVPDTRSLMSWKIGDHGFVMELSTEVPERIKGSLRPWLSDWLAKQGTSIAAVDHWIVHPGGPRILDAVESALGFSDQTLRMSREILQRYGNMSSPTVVFILSDLLRQGASGSCVQLAFGPGLTVEAAMLQLGN